MHARLVGFAAQVGVVVAHGDQARSLKLLLASAEQGRLFVGGRPVGADGSIHVASMRTGLVSQLDGVSLDTRTSQQLDGGVNRILVLPDDDTMLVANAWTDMVTVLDTEDLGIQFLLPVPKSPPARAFDATAGRLVVGSAEHGTVSVYEADRYDLHGQMVLGMSVSDIAMSAAHP